MTVALVLLAATALGVPFARALDPRARVASRLGLAFLLSAGWIAVWLFVLAVLGVRWSAAAVGLPLVLGSAAVQVALRGNPLAAPGDPLPRGASGRVAAAAVLALAVGYALYATLAAPWEWDFWAIWGLKGKRFVVTRGVDWAWLQSPWNDFTAPGHPLLVPLLYASTALPTGEWSDRWLGAVNPAFAIAATLIASRFLREDEAPPAAAAIGAVAVFGSAATPWIGYAEGAFIAYAAAALLYLRQGLRADDRRSLLCGSVLLGLAAWTKNEGTALLLAATCAAAVVRWRRPGVLASLWPAFAMLVLWQVPRHAAALVPELFGGDPAARLAARLPQWEIVLGVLASNPPDRTLFWLAIAIGLLALARPIAARERFLALAISLQLGGYLIANLLTPRDLAWQLAKSWPRLADQMAIPLTLLVYFAAVGRARGRAAGSPGHGEYCLGFRLWDREGVLNEAADAAVGPAGRRLLASGSGRSSRSLPVGS